MKTSARTEAKRYIYRCLATILHHDAFDNGADYMMEILQDVDSSGGYEGQKLSDAVFRSLVDEVCAELTRRSVAKPSSPPSEPPGTS